MLMNIFEGILIPFVGTTLGAACVFFMRKTLSKSVQRALAGFAAGIMVAASIWSLLIPAIKQSENMGRLSFVPAVVGFWIGILFLLALDHLIPHLHVGSNQAEGPKSKLGRTTMMVLAVTLHNIPEGMAVGVMYAGFLAENAQITIAESSRFSRPGYTVSGWKCSYDDKEYKPGTQYVVPGADNIDFTAVWAPAQYNINISANNGNSADKVTVKAYYNDEFVLPECDFTYDGKVFAGWKYNGVIYQPGESFTVPALLSGEKIVIVATWK